MTSFTTWTVVSKDTYVNACELTIVVRFCLGLHRYTRMRCVKPANHVSAILVHSVNVGMWITSIAVPLAANGLAAEGAVLIVLAFVLRVCHSAVSSQ